MAPRKRGQPRRRPPERASVHGGSAGGRSGASAAAGRPSITPRAPKLSESVARAIVHEIVHDRLQPGAVLPPENAMLTSYEVGRASLREALRILEVHGLISIRPGPGGGPVVASATSERFGRMATLYFQVARATFRELIETRLVLEPVMARLAAQRQDRSQLAGLEQSVRQHATVGSGDDAGYLRVSTDWHTVVSGLSGNRILDLLGRGMKDVYTARLSGIVFGPENRVQVARDHEAITRAILKGEAARAERLMRVHMTEWAAAIESRYPGMMDEVVDWG